MENCVFCKIINRELPASIVYENEYVIAFLDISPINKGHTLVVPKEHHASISPVPAEFQQHILTVSSAIGRALIKSSEYDGFNLHLSNGGCAGQTVDHAHMHVIPRVGTDGFHWNWRALKYEDNEQSEIISNLQEKLKINES